MLDRLAPPTGSVRKRKRVGRGHGSQGKTSGRGHKGQNSRSGGGVSPWFEGGQTPLKMRLPKRGFKNPFRKTFDIVNVGDLGEFKEGDLLTPLELKEAGLVSGKNPVKVLGDGEIQLTLTVKAHKFSKSAVAKLTERGGKAETI